MKSGFVSILGRPNVGKSTLLNNILNYKVSIVSEKAQTTRNNIQGIYNSENSQIIFIDTPGIHKPRQKLGKELNSMAFSSAHEVDVNVLVVDASKYFGDGDQYLIDHLDIHRSPLIIVLNKIDEAKLPWVSKLKDKYKELFPEAKIIETVATERFNLDELLLAIEDRLPEGPTYYERDVISDKDDIFRIKEIIREKVLRELKDEVPHSIAIYMNEILYDEDPLHIRATLIVEKESQKGIVIGKAGKRIKLIGSRARKDIEEMLKKHVYLELFVKVENDWRNQDNLIKKFGYKKEK